MSERPPFLEAPSLKPLSLHLRHGFFGRRGGVSEGLYASLNTGLGSQDKADRVQENRNLICDALGAAPGSMVTVSQAHTNKAVVVTKPFLFNDMPEADAVVTDRPGLVLTALAADCAPVLMCDPQANVACAAHAGWRGAVSGILENAVEAMISLGADPANMIAAVGPCLAQSSFEVGPEFENDVLQTSAWAGHLFIQGQGDRLHFDLKRYCQARLARCGLARIEALQDDTLTQPDIYFSYRGSRQRNEPDYGRNASSIVLLG